MADYIIQSETLDNIANAINTKTGESSAMTPAQMVTAIGSISGGTTIADGVVVKSRNTNGYITAVDKYGNCGAYEFGIASVGFREFPYGYLTSVALHDCYELKEGAFNNKFITQITGLENITYCGAKSFYGSSLPSIHLPKASRVGNTCFRSLVSATEIFLPLVEFLGEYVFQASTTLQNVQIGSVGHPAPTTNNQPFYGCTQQGLTITAFQTGANVDTIIANYRRNATNATIIIKASEATTYNGTSYAAGDTIITSEVTP